MFPPALVKIYVVFVRKYRYAILALWTGLVMLGLVYGTKFISETTTAFTAPPGCAAAKAEDTLYEYFPQEDGLHAASIVIQSKTGESVFDEGLGATLDTFNRMLYQSINTSQTFAGYGSWYTYTDVNLPLLAEAYRANETDATTYISVRYDGSNKDAATDFINDLSYNVDKYLEQLGLDESVIVRETGVDYFQADTLAGTKKDMATMDKVILPIAILVLALIIQNLPIMFVSVVTIFATILVEFLIMYPVALHMDVVSFTPSFMTAITYAMSIDYSLFLLSRFCEEHRSGSSLDEAIAGMLQSAGGTIAVSGGTLMICFVGLVFVPMDLIRSVGIGSAVSLFIALLTNLTLVPTLLFMSSTTVFWIHQYINFEKLTWKSNSETSRSTRYESILFGNLGNVSSDEAATKPLMMTATDDPDFMSSSSPNATDEFEQDDLDEVNKSIWYRLGRFILSKWGILIFLLALGLTMPINIYCLSFETTITFDAMVPHSADSFKAFNTMSTSFGAGAVMPYRIVFVSRNATESIFSEDGYTRVQSVIAAMTSNLPYTESNEFTGAVIVAGENITWQNTVTALTTPEASRTATQQTYAVLYGSYVSTPDVDGVQRATYTQFNLLVDPYSTQGTDWIDNCRSLMDEMETAYDLDIYLAEGATIEYDAVTKVYSLYPAVIAVTMSIVFLFMAGAFKSLLAPLRLVGTIILTLTFSYGLAVLTYQHGAFEWMHQRAFSNYHSLDWLPPIMCFSIVVGLGLDYDVFLVGRVLEYRMDGYTSDGSILKGLYKTGHIITAAGIIMALAFSGLFLSEAMVLNQVAFFLVTAVLLDTFIVRTVLVPILMGIAGTHAWWPLKVPHGFKSYGLGAEI